MKGYVYGTKKLGNYIFSHLNYDLKICKDEI